MLKMQVRVKGEKIRAQQASQQFLTPGQDGKDIRIRKRNMKKESNRRVRKPFPEHTRQEHQMVIMNPDPVARPELIDHSRAEPAVCFDIGVPAFGVELQPGGKTVKQGPEGLIGIPLVKLLQNVRRQVN